MRYVPNLSKTHCGIVLAPFTPLSGASRGKVGRQTLDHLFMIYVYVLQSLKDNGYYIGICKNLENRLDKHNHGSVRSTKHRKPFKLVYSEIYSNYGEARVREKELKSFKGGNKFRELIG